MSGQDERGKIRFPKLSAFLQGHEDSGAKRKMLHAMNLELAMRARTRGRKSSRAALFRSAMTLFSKKKIARAPFCFPCSFLLPFLFSALTLVLL